MARSAPIAPNVGRLSRSQLAGKRGLYKGECAEVQLLATWLLGCLLRLCDFTGKKTGTAPAKVEKPATVEKSIGGAKNGEKRTISTDKASKYYPVRSDWSSKVSPNSSLHDVLHATG